MAACASALGPFINLRATFELGGLRLTVSAGFVLRGQNDGAAQPLRVNETDLDAMTTSTTDEALTTQTRTPRQKRTISVA